MARTRTTLPRSDKNEKQKEKQNEKQKEKQKEKPKKPKETLPSETGRVTRAGKSGQVPSIKDTAKKMKVNHVVPDNMSNESKHIEITKHLADVLVKSPHLITKYPHELNKTDLTRLIKDNLDKKK